ncbi:MAG TPA: MDR family MFS transporter [Tepidiformaceae bacterium]|jgi:EmrB/QacA subfamily drug resistance transporter|nr:MDR family MFS transporter [Tepidiformaceae bacterium]
MVRRLHYKYIVAIVFMFGLFMDMVDSTVVNIAVPQLSKDFHASTASVEWTVTGYLLSLAVFIPAAGFLSDRFGTKKSFLTAMAIFLIASALCGQARSLQELIFFRFLQGMGGGMMTPVGTAMLSREFPGAERAKASAIISIPVVFGPTMGPVLGGYLIEYVSWRWIFYINLPIGIIGFLFGLKYLTEHKEPYARTGFDFIGLVTGGVGAALLLYALSEAATSGWTSNKVVFGGLAGIALGAVFVWQELRAHPPMIDLSLFKRPLFTLGNAMIMPAFGVFSGFIFILTLYLQELQGRSPLEAGLIQAPSAIGTAISLPIAARIYTRVGPRRMMIVGFTGAVLTMAPFAFLTASSPAWIIVTFLTIRGLPFAFAMVAAQTIIFGPIENDKQGPCSSAYNTLRQVAASFGVALIATVAITRQHFYAAGGPVTTHAAELGYRDAYLACVALMVLPLFLVWFINDKKADTEMSRRLAMEPAGAAQPSLSH